MTFSREDTRPKLTIRVGEKKKKELKAYADNEGKSMSSIVREAIDDKIGKPDNVKIKSKKEVTPPAEDDLSTGWHILCRLSDENGNVNADTAKNVISQEVGISQDLVEHSIIKPLANRGYLTVKPRLETVVYSLRVYYNE